MSTTAILKDLVSQLSVSDAPSRTHRHGKWVEVVCAIGKDETAYITMTKEAYDNLMSKGWGND